MPGIKQHLPRNGGHPTILPRQQTGRMIQTGLFEKVISTMVYPDKDATGVAVFAEGKAVINPLKM